MEKKRQNVVLDVVQSGTVEGIVKTHKFVFDIHSLLLHPSIVFTHLFPFLWLLFFFLIIRECQVKHWKKHKAGCDMLHQALNS